MALDQETINAQLALLAAHRRTLAHLLEQAAQFDGEVFAPPQTANGIAEARAAIQRIKAALREGGAVVENEPNDEASPAPEPDQRAGGDVVMGDKVSGDKVMGDKRTINTEGGDYAEGNIDKRQGAFISGGTIYGPVVGVNQGSVTANYTVQQRPDPALHHLRAVVSDFVGREQEIDDLVQALTNDGGTAATISGVRGMGGIGKTELAYVVSNRLKDTFSDAQLVVELRGASSSPMTSEAALQQVIRAFEREAKLPDDLSQLKGIYNSVLTGKKVLIVADDAKEAAQVRPLLPPPGCALLITSRNRFNLPGMVALDLGTLSPAEAEKLLVEICPGIGERAGELAKLCGYLPLALRVSASLLKENDSREVSYYLEQLQAGRLKHLSDPDNADDPQASVDASLKLSYDALEPVAQSVLCQISVFPKNFDLVAAKSIIIVEGDVEETLELLRRRSLLVWDSSSQWGYTLHDLVRDFASKRLDNSAEVILRHAEFVDYIWGAKIEDVRSIDSKEHELSNIDLLRDRLITLSGNHRADNLLVDWFIIIAGYPTIEQTDSEGNPVYEAQRDFLKRWDAVSDAVQRTGDKERMARVSALLGRKHILIGEIQKGYDYLSYGYSMLQTIGCTPYWGPALYFDFAKANKILNKMVDAIHIFERTIEYSINVSKLDLYGSGTTITAMRQLLENYLSARLPELDKSVEYSYDVKLELDGIITIISVMKSLGEIYLSLKELRRATEYLECAITYIENIPYLSSSSYILEKFDALRTLSYAYERFGNTSNLSRAIELVQACIDESWSIGERHLEADIARLNELRQRLAASQSLSPADTPDEP